MLTQHLQKLRHAVTVQRTFPLKYKHLQNASLSSMSCILQQTIRSSLVQSVTRNTSSSKVIYKKINTNTLQIIMNVLRFFFNSPRHSGSNVGNKYVILYTKSRQAGGGRERIVREKQSCLFHDLLRSTFLLKKSTLSLFTVKIPGSRDRKDV